MQNPFLLKILSLARFHSFFMTAISNWVVNFCFRQHKYGLARLCWPDGFGASFPLLRLSLALFAGHMLLPQSYGKDTEMINACHPLLEEAYLGIRHASPSGKHQLGQAQLQIFYCRKLMTLGSHFVCFPTTNTTKSHRNASHEDECQEHIPDRREFSKGQFNGGTAVSMSAGLHLRGKKDKGYWC